MGVQIGMDFATHDRFERKPFAERLTRVLLKFHPFYEEAFVLSLNARFGSGKTTFLQMWKTYLEKEHQLEVVCINAWETDFDAEPIVPLASALLEYVQNQTKLGGQLKDELRKVLGTLAISAQQVVEHVAGLKPDEAEEKVNIIRRGEAVYKEYSYKRDAYDALRKALRAYVEKLEGKPLVVFVDELDRARPDYAVHFLEAIKHIFSVKGVCFVLAVDKGQLGHSVRQLYGARMDFENYYRRFVTREAELPEPVKVDYRRFVDDLAQSFLREGSGVHFAFKAGDRPQVLQYLATTAQGMGLTPRQTENLFRIFSQFMAVEDTDRFAKSLWVRGAITLIAISMADPAFYKKVGEDGASPKELADFIFAKNYRKLSDKHALHYALYTVLAGCVYEGHQVLLNEAVDELIKFENRKVNTSDEPELRREKRTQLVREYEAGGELPPESMFSSVYRKIEDWRDFLTQ